MHFPTFPLRRIALIVTAIYAPHALAAAAGRIEFSTGETVVRNADGRERPARKGEAIAPGERVLTRSGRAQVAFTDGSFVSLQPNTDFGVDEYVFKGSNDGSEKSVFSLLKGALRTVTGFIGRSKRDAYTMNTPTATIGIRGTGGRIEVNGEGTFIQGTSGTWLLSNAGGTLDVPAGSRGFAGLDTSKPPEQTSTTPSTPPTGTVSKFDLPPTYTAGDQLGGIPPIGMADGSGYKVLHVSTDGLLGSVASTTAKFTGSTTLNGFVDGVGQTIGIGSMSVSESGNDSIIGWGRWTGGQYTVNGVNQSAMTANQGLHYVVGIPTAVMPTTGVANYSLLGATKPTDLNGVFAPGTFTLNNMSVNFGTSSYSLGFGVNINSNNYTASASGSLSGNGFSSALSVSCYTVCSGSVQGAFFGASAQRLGIAYTVYDSQLAKTFTGAAALKSP